MSLGEKSRFQISLPGWPVRSLCWQKDELVDWAGGGARFSLDGSTVRSSIRWAYHFDRAIASSNGNYQVIYEALGTKGLVLKGNKLIREISRSFYHADVYEFPVAILNLANGVVGLAHCPEEYNRLEIEEIESGIKLTARPGESPDFFHSRLQTSTDGKYLLSAGWVWHPLDCVQLFSIPDALNHPGHLDGSLPVDLPQELCGVSACVFQGNNSLLLAGRDEFKDKAAYYVAQYDIKEARIKTKSELQTLPGTIMPVGDDHFVGFYECPKLFEISSGKIIQSWPELDSGKQTSSIIAGNQAPLPPLALDPERHRFAVANPKSITVVQLG